MATDSLRIGVIGLGYVGLPVALAFARKFPGTIGFDINAAKVAELCAGVDRTGEVDSEVLTSSSLRMSSDPSVLRGCNFYVVCVPTPVDANHRPDLTPMISASKLVGEQMGKGATIVFESTVYPGVTEQICGPVLAKASGLRQGADFKLGYSPERINPGDKEHTLERIVKVVSGEDAETLDIVADAYGAIVDVGVFRAASIKVAEAAKVIENTQRDLNIALMNELSMIFDRVGIRTRDVLDAAGTKWNFLKFSPGLVGGHCIGVDPYYLTELAERLGYHPQVILAGRRINDGMGNYVAQRLVKLLTKVNRPIRGAKIGVCGLTFKENVADLRNSRVPDIIAELRDYGMNVVIHDPFASPEEAHEEYGLQLTDWSAFEGLDAVVFAVPHRQYLKDGGAMVFAALAKGGVVVDVKSALRPEAVRSDITYWSL
jgi:UDP-N-acetyl-D-galactosamine dehydrogenase